MTAPSLAQRYRHHRKVFLLALEMGVTPREAEAEMRRIEAREKARAARDRLDAKVNAPLRGVMGTVIIDESAVFEPRDPAPWMMRD